MAYAGGRNTVRSYSRELSRGLIESTAYIESAEPIIECEWGYLVASKFQFRYYTVKQVGDLWCGSCRDERIRPKHIQAVLDFIAAKEVVTTEVTTSQINVEGMLIPAKATVYRVGGHAVYHDTHFQCWFCSCGGDHPSTGCEHGTLVRRHIATKEQAA